MNRKSLIAAAALAAAGLSTAYAGSLTRDEVKAELRDLKAAGLYEPVTEASPTPLQDADRTAKISMIQERDQLARATPSQEDLVAMSDRADEAPVIIIDRVPQDPAVPQDDAPAMDSSGALPFDHPAVRDGAPSDEAPQVPAQ